MGSTPHEIILSKRAKQDVEDICLYIEYRDSLYAADQFKVDFVIEVEKKLKNFPELHKQYKAIPKVHYFVFKKNYLVFYTTRDNTVYVINVRHGGKDQNRSFTKSLATLKREALKND
ncbi:MAG: type II toxin-antitoxin system RelE/ParE family toxin [Verrucomicrobiota bacterium]